MQIQTILLIVLVGAVAVLAKKGSSSSSSEEDRNGYGVVQVWPHYKPGRGPKPHKFKGPKHPHFIVSRPEQQQPQFYPQYPQYPQGPQYPQVPQYPQGPQYPQAPQYPQVPQYPQGPQYPQVPEQQPGEQMITLQEVDQYLEQVQKEMQKLSAQAYKEFQKVDNEIERNRKHMEDTMKSNFQTLELALEAKQAREIEQAVKDGKDELKIQECVAEEENAFRADMDADIQRTVDCVNDATERARKSVASMRNAFTETSVEGSMQAKEWAQKARYCAQMKDGRCVRSSVALMQEKIGFVVEEGGQAFKNIQDAPKRQMVQMEYCRGNFMDDLKDMKEAYSKMVKRCVIASEIQEPEEEDDEETGKPGINVEVKPEVKPEIEVEA